MYVIARSIATWQSQKVKWNNLRVFVLLVLLVRSKDPHASLRMTYRGEGALVVVCKVGGFIEIATPSARNDVVGRTA